MARHVAVVEGFQELFVDPCYEIHVGCIQNPQL